MFADASNKGKIGTVIAVVLVDSSNNNLNKVDVFGHKMDPSQLENPYVRVVVKMEDGSLIACTGYERTIVGSNLLLNTSAIPRDEEITNKLQRAVGTTVYTAGYTELLKNDVTMEQIHSLTQRQLARDIFVPNLNPIKITEAKLIDDDNSVILRVMLPNHSERILYGNLSTYDLGKAVPFFERMQIYVLTHLPKVSARERQAIKDGTVYRGMSENGLYMTMGYPNDTNNWGSGGQQLIYGDGHTYVYVQGGGVVDFQSMGD